MTSTPSSRMDAIGQIRDVVLQTTAQKDAFLYYLPEILERPDFINIEAPKALEFARMALTYQRTPVIEDALRILNKLVDPSDGTLVAVSRDSFYNNQNFFWNELGERTKPLDIIMHVLNKATFLSTLGRAS